MASPDLVWYFFFGPLAFIWFLFTNGITSMTPEQLPIVVASVAGTIFWVTILSVFARLVNG